MWFNALSFYIQTISDLHHCNFVTLINLIYYLPLCCYMNRRDGFTQKHTNRQTKRFIEHKHGCNMDNCANKWGALKFEYDLNLYMNTFFTRFMQLMSFTQISMLFYSILTNCCCIQAQREQGMTNDWALCGDMWKIWAVVLGAQGMEPQVLNS